MEAAAMSADRPLGFRVLAEKDDGRTCEVVVCDKREDAERAAAMLRALGGRAHVEPVPVASSEPH